MIAQIYLTILIVLALFLGADFLIEGVVMKRDPSNLSISIVGAMGFWAGVGGIWLLWS